MKYTRTPSVIFTVALFFSLIFAAVAEAQNEKSIGKKEENHSLEVSADSLLRLYNFSRAKNIYKEIIRIESNEALKKRIETKIILCDNGEAMLNYVAEPKVAGSETFDKKDFFLHYPGISINGSFVEIPSVLAAKGGSMYLPSNAKVLYYSASDKNGSWNIYCTRLGEDGMWSAPKVLNGNITSSGNEVFPYVTSDGKKLYFSSNGHYGAGGYDLYVCEWDDSIKDWGTAQNMGFPYSSPADDLFFFNTPDGKFSVFASTRNFYNPQDKKYNPGNITVYVLGFEAVPLKHQASPEEALNISKLKPGSGYKISSAMSEFDKNQKNKVIEQLEKVDSVASNASADTTVKKTTENYTAAARSFRNLQSAVNIAIARQKSNRSLYSSLEKKLGLEADSASAAALKDSLAIIGKSINDQELNTLDLQERMTKAGREVRRIEENFLSNGIIAASPAQENNGTKETTDENNSGSAANAGIGIEFEYKAAIEPAPVMKVEKKEPVIDLNFKTGKTAWIGNYSMIPDGLIYQIRFFSSSRKASLSSLKGISPVFEKKTGSMYQYYAGIFYSYSDALKESETIRRLGFRSVIITALNNGDAISTAAARNIERKTAGTYNVIIRGYENSLPDDFLTVLKACTSKDIIKAAEDTGYKYTVGPFESATEANATAEKLKAVSDKKISVEKTENKEVAGR